MKFRPCIDIHNGKVKQLVGGSLRDKGDTAEENFVSDREAPDFAGLYKKDGLKGGHIIILNSKDSKYYEATKKQALKALMAYPGGMQIGGGITAENAMEYIEAGASHIIVTSYVFKDGKINYDNLNRLKETVGKDRIVLDLSCRKKDGHYYIVTDRWQKFTEECINEKQLDELSKYCDEFLIHGVDAEGKSGGMEKELVEILAKWNKIPITYAGGISSIKQIEEFKRISGGKMDFTIGSALDLFGGKLPYNEIKNIK
ncbi:phosphoribosylformimino-5-aminoimidazole carboxamide ribotide isomerase [uncultured Eubacterium sp.]|uniref:phosphoribosylformimino-5-aminoimidazole carboxamide ribotide isomerase n=1 Tax=uncultured Eubacterium sp. TaxID=165185 RepID=UPI00261FB9B1|nr:phosphoribosylformimino-5-aminoimidazole carboxamide ribotide isomerase [uncultured Eubacterium sp.]